MNKTLQGYKEILECEGYNVFAISIKGSQNYNLADEHSDIDVIAVTIPTLDDILFKKGSQNRIIKTPTGDIFVNPINDFAIQVSKGGLTHIFDAFVPNGFNEDLIRLYHDIELKANPKAFQCMTHKDLKVVFKDTEASNGVVAKHGYNYKKFASVLRMVDIVENDFKLVKYQGLERLNMMEIKRGKVIFSTSEVVSRLADAIERMDKIVATKDKFKFNEIPYKAIGDLVIKYNK